MAGLSEAKRSCVKGTPLKPPGSGSSASDEPRKRRRDGADLRLAGESTQLPTRGSALWSSVLGASQMRTGRNTRRWFASGLGLFGAETLD